jgi:hypothetical protein
VRMVAFLPLPPPRLLPRTSENPIYAKFVNKRDKRKGRGVQKTPALLGYVRGLREALSSP